MADVLREALPSDAFIREVCKDARDLVVGAAIHLCFPTYWKYHSSKVTQICRHGFYHVVVLTDWDGTPVKRRRQGKHLYGCMAICRETKYGMAGRLITLQTHPYECPTNYAALIAMRCNIDFQDLRRVPPPKLWMLPAEVEPEVDLAQEARHVCYPQRLPQFSLGSQSTWGWMQHLATTPSANNWSDSKIDWLSRLQQLVVTAEHGAADGEDLASLLSTCAAAAKEMFVTAHNAGYYINSYTTKVNPGMDNVMRKIMEGIRNLHNTWDEEAANKEKSEAGEPATSKRQDSFRKALQMLNRLDTS